MPEFHETIRGAQFFDSIVPNLSRSLARIADSLEKQQGNPARDAVVEAAIAYYKENGCCGTDCDLKNRVEEYLKL